MQRDIVQAWRDAQNLRPSAEFVRTPEGRLTYGDLLREVPLIAALFRHHGVAAGDRLVVASVDERSVVLLALASLRCGVAFVPLDPTLPAPAATRLMAAARPRLALLDSGLSGKWQLPASVTSIGIAPPQRQEGSLFSRLLGRTAPASEDSFPSLLARFAPVDLPDAVPGDCTAYVIFTSGTTAQPKGVSISHQALAAHLETLMRHFAYETDSRIVNGLPLHHADGLVQGPLVAFQAGGCVIRPLPFTVAAIPELLDTICRERATHLVAVPTLLALIARVAPPGEDCFRSPAFRFVISTAALLHQQLWEEFEARFGTRVANVYGLTETVAGSLFSGPDAASHRPGTVGCPVDCELRIVAADGAVVPPGTEGELLLSGPHLMSGYLDDPESTGLAIRGGWLHTGDIASLDADGLVRIVGRMKNLVISSGFNIHPEEVAELLCTHAAVAEAAAFGQPDPTWGEILIACVVLRPAAEGPVPDEAALTTYCRQNLESFKVPGRIQIVPALPKGPSGKVVIEQVRRLATEETDAAATDRMSTILKLAARCFRTDVELLTAQSTAATTPGWDSLGHLELVVALETAFSVRLSPADIVDLTSLAAADRIICANLCAS